MSKPEWGSKHICHSCGARYYDMQRDPIVCPKCNTKFDPEAFLKSRRTRATAVEEVAAPKVSAAAKKKAAAAAAEPAEAAEVESEADDATSGLDAIVADAEEGVSADGDTASAVADDDDDDEDDDSNVLLEDASELGDDDVEKVVDIGKDDDPNA